MAVQSTLLIDRRFIEELSGRRGEPEWMRERRLEALRLYNETPWPNWDRTDLSALNLEKLRLGADPPSLPQPPGPSDPAALPEPLRQLVGDRWDPQAPEGGQLVHCDGVGAMGRLAGELARKGVIFTGMDTALRQHPELLRRYFMTQAVTPADGKLEALHGALWQGGTFLYVPRGVEVSVPFESLWWESGSGLALFPHTLIVLEPEAKVQFVESYLSGEPGQARTGDGGTPFQAAVVEVICGQGAKLLYGSIQDLATGVWNFTTRKAVVAKDGSVDWVLGEFGSRLSRTGYVSLLQGAGAASTSQLVFFGNESQHLDLVNEMIHQGTHTTSNITAKGVLHQQGRAVYRATTHIRSGARDSSAYQRGNILMLSEDSRGDANPSVLVDENEVLQAGHAATVGQVDREMLFYLMSRGLPEPVATKLIIDGFLASVIEKVPIEAVRRQMQRLIDRKMLG